MKVSWGSWIGLLGVIVVVALVAIPMYGDYTDRAQVSEAVSLLGAAKTPLAEYFSDHKKWPVSLERLVENRQGKYTQSIAITKGAGGTGELELTGTMRNENVVRSVAGRTVRLSTADGGRSWLCRPGTIGPKYLPGSCRE
jgi:type IV pilus assembly protein PilA